MDMSKSVMLCCLLSVQPCYAGYVFVSPKLGVYGEALGGPDTVGKAVKQADGTKIAPKIWYYAPRTPLFGVDIGYQADNGLLFRVNLDAALTRLMFRSQCVVGYSLRFGWGGGTSLSLRESSVVQRSMTRSTSPTRKMSRGLLLPPTPCSRARSWRHWCVIRPLPQITCFTVCKAVTQFRSMWGFRITLPSAGVLSVRLRPHLAFQCGRMCASPTRYA
ncbi:hypothetical protein ACTWRV_00131 [Treponema pallidum subsp. pallidum]